MYSIGGYTINEKFLRSQLSLIIGFLNPKFC